ncbi:sulfate adenylyltransferase subunit 1 [Compostibacter hankyongensis]|uniref:sulfate adenylyltransferase n=1 Tax=Compostibacter hankyongensis TaxID=1007089 RepID=A0ABP8FX92_9BACT
MEVLHIATAGSVDDGKSTLIGRLLYDTQSVPQDKLAAIEQSSKRKGLDFTDLSLLTDGLIAEREQGITIDVAHIYFSTPSRKYIIADTPGHFEYTRNMVTGASNAQVSVILIDARNGVVDQTYRHFYIASLLRIPHLVVCVNKMDLVQYSEARYNQIVEDFQQVIGQTHFRDQDIQFIPLSSLYGENVVRPSSKIPWYNGPTLLDSLENIAVDDNILPLPARFQVQYAIRPKTDVHRDFRGYAGKVSSGQFAVGDEVVVLPTRQQSRIRSIQKFTTQLPEAHARESITLTLEDDLDISRGNMLAKPDALPEARKEFNAIVCWMDHQPLTAGATLLLQHGTHLEKARVQAISGVTDVRTLQSSPDHTRIQLNDIGTVTLKTARPIFADAYTDNPANGAFILIDAHTHNTAGVGFIQQ